MKKIFFCLVVGLISTNFSLVVKAQGLRDDPGAYMNAISDAVTQMNKSYMAYVSVAAHSSRKRKIEKLRMQAVDAIVNSKYQIIAVPIYKGDNSLRQSSINYVQLCYKVFNEDYAHIVNMEDIAEQSYDGMQAFLLLQEATDDTLKVANERIEQAENDFAAKYNVKMVEQKTELGEKMGETEKLNHYRDKVYLSFFKCSWQDNQLVDALNKKNVTKIEQTRSALDKYAIEGLAALDTLKAFENDPSLAVTCKQAMAFYKKEAETDIPKISDYMLKAENFEKIKAAMDAKTTRTQQDVDSYNASVKDVNAAANTSNQTNNDLNNARTQVVNNWNQTEKTFLDGHTPYFKK